MISSPKSFLLCVVLCLLFCEAFLQQKCCPENKGEYHIYAGCVWASNETVSTFAEAVEICEKEGGQLATFEKFPTEKDFTDYTATLTESPKGYVGVKRNGPNNEFEWLTGTILEKSSFFWYTGEPRNYNFEVACGHLYNGKLDDIQCTEWTETKANCQVFPP